MLVLLVAAMPMASGYKRPPSEPQTNGSHVRAPRHRGARRRKAEQPQQVALGEVAHPQKRLSSAVGPLFYGNGRHHCTASVVDSPGGDLLVTAAHCIYGGGGYHSGMEFAPGYSEGAAPSGRWQAAAMFVDRQWVTSRAEDDDVGFILVRPNHGQTVEEAVGAERLGIGYGPVNQVTVTGYPTESGSPVICTRASSSWSPGQMRFDCDGFSGGTSGGPWVTGSGEVIGVIGGYQRGGDTPDVSYSPRFGDRVRALYNLAAASRP